MIIKTEPNRYESDEGYSVEPLGRTGIRYQEGPRTMHVYTEFCLPTGIAIWSKSVKAWQAPYEREVLSQADVERILRNICAVVDFTGQPASVL
jgi:hypothetical protein